MKPEPLKGKIQNLTILEQVKRPEGISTPESGWKNKKGIAVNDIKSAVEWYKIYLNDPLKFVLDFPNYKKELNMLLKIDFEIVQKENLPLIYKHYKSFNIWLLNKAFEDVTNDSL